MPCRPDATHHYACACREEAHLLETSELKRERDEALQEVATMRAECASISAEFDLPPTMRPAEGEIRRMRQTMRECADVADAYKRERDEAREALAEHERRTNEHLSVVAAARELVSWDWLHLLTIYNDYGEDIDDVRHAVAVLERALEALDKSQPPMG